jgi:cobalamin-dependent methionine synthase I
MDGTLRHVIAGTTAQREELEEYLQAEYERGRLVYGLDASAEVMVTCFVVQNEQEHVHFVDGADGGYAHAAQALKARESALSD